MSLIAAFWIGVISVKLVDWGYNLFLLVPVRKPIQDLLDDIQKNPSNYRMDRYVFEKIGQWSLWTANGYTCFAYYTGGSGSPWNRREGRALWRAIQNFSLQRLAP